MTARRFVRPDQILIYPIHFENIGTIEARDVFVTDVLDPALDESTLNIITSQGASFDLATRMLKWDLLNINLPPGETGNLLIAIKPRLDIPSGTVIRNKATIKFEVFESLDTNEVETIIDSTKPTCTMNLLPTQTSSLEFPISWNETDAVGEIESYSVLVSVDGGSFIPFLEKTSDTNAIFNGDLGKTYGFLCIATDTAGNIEVQDTIAETTTRLVSSEACNDGADNDGDGLIDLLDPDCPSAVLTIEKGTLNLDPDLSEDKLSLQITFSGAANSINPPTEGVTLTLSDANGVIT